MIDCELIFTYNNEEARHYYITQKTEKSKNKRKTRRLISTEKILTLIFIQLK